MVDVKITKNNNLITAPDCKGRFIDPAWSSKVDRQKIQYIYNSPSKFSQIFRQTTRQVILQCI